MKIPASFKLNRPMDASSAEEITGQEITSTGVLPPASFLQAPRRIPLSFPFEPIPSGLPLPGSGQEIGE